MKSKTILTLATALILAACGGQNTGNANQTASGATSGSPAAGIELLNVSYDVIRDFYKEYNPLFVKHYQAQNPNASIKIQQSHGGSSKQALSVANGLQADVVSMNQNSDIELLQKKQLVENDWQKAFPNHAVPFTSISVILVRKGNPKNIQDWADLAKDGTQLIIANPKTSGNGRYAFLGAFGNALKQNNGDQAAAKAFAKKMLANVAVLDAGGRGATTTFAQRGLGDALVTFENEAKIVVQQFGEDKFEIVYPKYTIAAESPVAVVKSVTDKKGTTAAATEYLQYLWSDEAQELAAKLHLRPSNAAILAKHEAQFPKVETFAANDVFGTWDEIMKNYFADGGIFDEVNKR